MGFKSPNQLRIYTMAFAKQQGFTVNARGHGPNDTVVTMICYRGQNAWRGKVHGDCGMRAKINFGEDGSILSFDGVRKHSHALDNMGPSESPFKCVYSIEYMVGLLIFEYVEIQSQRVQLQ